MIMHDAFDGNAFFVAHRADNPFAPRLHDVKDQEPRDQDAKRARPFVPMRSVDQFHDEGNAS